MLLVCYLCYNLCVYILVSYSYSYMKVAVSCADLSVVRLCVFIRQACVCLCIVMSMFVLCCCFVNNVLKCNNVALSAYYVPVLFRLCCRNMPVFGRAVRVSLLSACRAASPNKGHVLHKENTSGVNRRNPKVSIAETYIEAMGTKETGTTLNL